MRRRSCASAPNNPTLPLPVAVVQPLPGIGDMVWHLPHIAAIARHAGQPVTVLAKPRALADQLLANENAVASVLTLDLNPAGRRGAHDGIAGLVRLAGLLRGRRFGSIVLLHHSASIAAAAWLAGIPLRYGYGWGGQRWFLNAGPVLPRGVSRLHQHTRATRFLAAAGIALESAEPALTIPPGAGAAARNRLGLDGLPFVAVGIGSSETLRQWGAARFGQLAAALLDAGWPRLVLLGGPEDKAAAASVQSGLGDRIAVALGWDLAAVTGLLAEAAFYVGNNTGVMNMAAAAGIRTYALFGTIEPFRHASQIVPVTAPNIGVHDGIERVTPDDVMATIQADRGMIGPQGAPVSQRAEGPIVKT